MITRMCSIKGLRDDREIILPEECPICGSLIEPRIISAIDNRELYDNTTAGAAVALACPACQNLFIAKYYSIGYAQNMYSEVVPHMPKERTFDQKLSEISQNFIIIYNQALAAESYKLDQIAGMGYRKALEFLIKDYAKILEPAESENIEKMMLSPCINKYIEHPKIKATATASNWLGNDETHYIRKFDDKDIVDLKHFIDSCVYWILADYDASSAVELISK